MIRLLLLLLALALLPLPTLAEAPFTFGDDITGVYIWLYTSLVSGRRPSWSTPS